jgi:uncharacterized protein YndB with AHSA1/START domain
VASIVVETEIDASPAAVWDALRDWRALHQRLAPGFAVDLVVEGEDRVVTFAGGLVLRERIVSVDEERQRLAWSIVDGPYTHHNGVAQVIARNGGGTLFVWAADVLPHETGPPTREAMQRGSAVIKQTLESRTTA